MSSCYVLSICQVENCGAMIQGHPTDIWGEDAMKEPVHLFLLYSKSPVIKFSHHGFITYIITCFSVKQPLPEDTELLTPGSLRFSSEEPSAFILRTYSPPRYVKKQGSTGSLVLRAPRPDRRDLIVRAIRYGYCMSCLDNPGRLVSCRTIYDQLLAGEVGLT
jgi:hypothetical protein